MEFKEAFEAAKEGKSIRLNCAAAWLFLNEDCYLYKDKVGQKIADLAPKHYTMDTWEVEPEGIYMWGVTQFSDIDHPNDSLLFDVKPEKRQGKEIWQAHCSAPKTMKSGIFPNELQKYKLVPIED